MAVPSWWQNAICYQIYPRSFADSNGDGIGDLPGIIQKLDYLQWLGINALWISPFYPSPQFDVGYDISDYCDIDPAYGTLADFDRLLQEAHQRGIRILLDLVLNHTSDQHSWFQQSRSSKDNPYRDWYIWRDGKDGQPPNDWESIFGGSAWEYDEATGQYYYHFFFKEQPDLNWRNPKVEKAMLDAARFWLQKGVDGFRLDAIGTIYEVPTLLDSGIETPLDEIFLNWMERAAEDSHEKFLEKVHLQYNLPETHALMKRVRSVVDQYPNRILLGETDDVLYYGNGNDELHSVFNFDMLRLTQNLLDAEGLRGVFRKRLPTIAAGAWEANTVGNHDRPRSYNFYGDGQHDDLRARAALALTMFLRGTPVFYSGEEVGMTDYPIQDIETFRDNLGVWVYHTLHQKRGMSQGEALHTANVLGRDKCRTPMHWENAPNAGFSPSGVQTWLPINPNYAQGINVADQRYDSASMLSFFRKIVRVRQQNHALRTGDFTLLDTGQVFAFWRTDSRQACFVALNLVAEPVDLRLGLQRVRRIYSSIHSQTGVFDDLAGLHLAPYEIYVGERV